MYTNRDKARAIRDLIVNLGDVQKTAAQTHIPERTLRRWKNEVTLEYDLVYWDTDTDTFEIEQRYKRIRIQMLVEIETLLRRMSEVTPTQAATIATSVTRLTDRVAKIELILQNLGQYIIKIDTRPFTDIFKPNPHQPPTDENITRIDPDTPAPATDDERTDRLTDPHNPNGGDA